MGRRFERGVDDDIVRHRNHGRGVIWLAHVTETVTIGVGLISVGHSRAVIDIVRDAVAIPIRAANDNPEVVEAPDGRRRAEHDPAVGRVEIWRGHRQVVDQVADVIFESTARRIDVNGKEHGVSELDDPCPVGVATCSDGANWFGIERHV